jgi:outer membrane biosynthesis protein TonB
MLNIGKPNTGRNIYQRVYTYNPDEDSDVTIYDSDVTIGGTDTEVTVDDSADFRPPTPPRKKKYRKKKPVKKKEVKKKEPVRRRPPKTIKKKPAKKPVVKKAPAKKTPAKKAPAKKAEPKKASKKGASDYQRGYRKGLPRKTMSDGKKESAGGFHSFDKCKGFQKRKKKTGKGPNPYCGAIYNKNRPKKGK